MKYCIRQDRPMPTRANGEQALTGCEIYGVHHSCENCPNLMEMGDTAYTSLNGKQIMSDCKDCIQKCIHRKWGHICEYYATAEDRFIRLKEDK